MKSLVGLGALVIAATAAPAAHADPVGPIGPPPPAPNQLIVGFKKGTSTETQKRVIEDASGDRVQRLGNIRGQVVKPRGRLGLTNLRKRLLRDVDVEFVERDQTVSLLKTPNDPLFVSQYSENGKIGTQTTDAWNTKTSCSKVAVLDTGIDTDHPDLKDNIWKNSKETSGNGKDDDKNGYVDDYYGINLVKGKGSGTDDNGHGTHVAGIVGGRGNNSMGVSGVCWSTKLMAVKFMNSQGYGSMSKAIAGIEYAADKGAKIINASFGSSTSSEALKDQISEAKDDGVLIVVAAGNDGKDIDSSPTYPASYTNGNLLVAAASTSTDTLASFSNYGKTSVDLAAPGQDIMSTYLSGSYRTLDGTSMAAPMVAGVAALCRARNSDATYSELRKSVRKTVDTKSAFSGTTYSGGRVNTKRALDKVVDY
ncbi:MAG: S8 family peptidase [Solirubrobacterales bacterium]